MIKHSPERHVFSQTLAQALALTSLCLPAYVFGAGTPSFIPPIDGDLFTLLVKILNAAVYILFPFIVLMIVYTGFLFVTAQGNATKISQAREALVWTVVGALVVLGAKPIALAIEATVDSLRTAS